MSQINLRTQCPPFPPVDLCHTLIHTYFCHINILWPLLHRPTFEADFIRKRHMDDSDFACVVLGVFAVASRYCPDPRVLAKVPFGLNLSDDTNDIFQQWTDDLEGTHEATFMMKDASRMSAGWKYYHRMQQKLTYTTESITLNQLQTVHLAHQFLLGLPDRHSGWVMVGAALRRAQVKGLHRLKTSTPINLENELLKRAFWCLVVSERLMGLETGKNCLSLQQNIETDLPLPIDDSLWTPCNSNGQSFLRASPTEKSPSIEAFNLYANFSHIYERITQHEQQQYFEQQGKNGSGSSLKDILEELKAWMAFTPPPLPNGYNSKVEDVQSSRIEMASGLVRTSWPLFSDIFINISDALSRALNMKDTRCCLCPNDHAPIYMNDVPGLISLVTLVAVVVLNNDTRLYGSEPVCFDSSSRSQASSEVGSETMPASGSPYIIEPADLDDIVDLSITILEALQDQWATARHGLTWIHAARDGESDTPTESPTTAASVSVEHFPAVPYGHRDSLSRPIQPNISLGPRSGLPAPGTSHYNEQGSSTHPSLRPYGS
ncbi:fungal-specific transcription factor domain-containing protein [Hysterangium stoloniferum]|nr:fungal-specific transcription factor domain-containing protein [Hysterangium stoloniferum]